MRSRNHPKGEVLQQLVEFFVLTPHRLTQIWEREYANPIREAQRYLATLEADGLARRYRFNELKNPFGAAPYAYGLTDRAVSLYGGKTFDEHSLRTIDHELAITDFHIRLKQFCEKHSLPLEWQQSDLFRKNGLYPDARFTIDGCHFFLEIERQKTGDYHNGKSSIMRKAHRYYAHYNTDHCEKDWGFKQFRVIFQVENGTRAQNFLKTLEPIKHRMFWVGTPDNLDYRTPKDYNAGTYTFTDI